MINSVYLWESGEGRAEGGKHMKKGEIDVTLLVKGSRKVFQ